MSLGEKNLHLIQLDCDLVCKGQMQFSFTLFAYVMHHFTLMASEFKNVQNVSMHLPKIKTNLLSCPEGPLPSIWCSFCTDPNIMHFPSPQNLHTAQQTDKYLIRPAFCPTPPPPMPPDGNSHSGHERALQDVSAMSVFGNQSPCGGQSLPRSPVDASPAGAGAACLPGYKHCTDARA